MPAGGQRPSKVIVSVVDGQGRPFCAPGLGRWLARVAPARAHGEVTAAFASDARVRALNRTYRGVDAATDVLSFPGPGPRDAYGGQAPPFLGDIVIARGVARRQARAQGHAESTEWRVLALHGLLHLLGYDHEADNGAMRRLEERLRQRGGLDRGLIEREPRPPRLRRPRGAAR
ncbi:MAG: rRNA maturation RNase YbeY [Vicinamibacteria bacterium]|nr:rRNA maturation RNase YbeY [Vicinamibacteria bacterium]